MSWRQMNAAMGLWGEEMKATTEEGGWEEKFKVLIRKRISVNIYCMRRKKGEEEML